MGDLTHQTYQKHHFPAKSTAKLRQRCFDLLQSQREELILRIRTESSEAVLHEIILKEFSSEEKPDLDIMNELKYELDKWNQDGRF